MLSKALFIISSILFIDASVVTIGFIAGIKATNKDNNMNMQQDNDDDRSFQKNLPSSEKEEEEKNL